MTQSKHYLLIFLTITLALIATVFALAAPQTFTGVLSDSMCGGKHMLPGKTDAECTRECIKANSKYGLLVDKKVYTLSGSLREAPSLAGKQVRITGEKSGDTIAVKSISAADKQGAAAWRPWGWLARSDTGWKKQTGCASETNMGHHSHRRTET